MNQLEYVYPPMTRHINFTSQNGEIVASAEQSIKQSETQQESVEPQQSIVTDSDSLNLNSATDLRSLLASSFQQQDFLSVDEAFKLRLEADAENNINAVFEITEGYYLYKDKIQFTLGPDSPIKDIQLPEGKPKIDEYFGEVSIYDQSFTARIMDNAEQPELVIHANYQGCALEGICYAPVNQTFDLSDVLGVATNIANASDDEPSGNSTISTNTSSLKTEKSSLGTLLIGAFIAGILLTFTPCVLPLVPILSSIIAGQGKSLTRAKGGALALIYVFGTSVTYAAMGALAGATGDQLQAYFQNIWAISLLSGLFFIMALSMFGLFELQMPRFIQERIQSNTQNWGGSIPLVFLLGLFSALIVGACVSPVLISVLSIAVSNGDPYLGAKLMFVMAFGMGLPLIALGIGAGHIIPRAGQWMDTVKHGFGIMLIAVAIYFLGTLPQVPVLLLWGSFFIITSVFFGATQTNRSESNWNQLTKGIGIVLLVWGIILLIGGFLGQRDILNPIPKSLFNSGASGSVAEHGASHPFIQVTNSSHLDTLLTEAKSNNKKVLVDYYADWCVDCVRMEKTTFTDVQVKEKLASDYLTIQVDVTDPNDEDKKQLKKIFSVFGPPATLFIDENGQLLNDKGFYGYMGSDEFLALISSI